MRCERVKEDTNVISNTDKKCEEMAFKDKPMKSCLRLQSIVVPKVSQRSGTTADTEGAVSLSNLF